MNLKYIDAHTMGEPTRILLNGLPTIKGDTMMDKKKYLEENLDYIRTMAMHEPRGHKDMFGAIILDPINEGSDKGVIFMDGGGYLNMCCHGSIGVSTLLVEKNYIEVVEPITHIKLDTPAGLIECNVEVEDGKIKQVSIINVASFLYKENIEIDIPEIGKVPVDISFGGSFFGLVKAEDLGVKVNVDNIDKLVDYGLEIRDILNREFSVVHPIDSSINQVDLVEIYDEVTSGEADLKNVVVFGDGQVDRSPCGTGTSAKLAALYSKGEIEKDEAFIYESITGTKFIGRVLEDTKVEEHYAIIPEITGRAFIIGYGHLVADDEDPFKYGFTLQ